MIQLVLNCNQTRLNVSKAVLRSVLRKTHHEKLIVAGQIPGTIVSLVFGDGSAQSYDSSRVHENTFANYMKISE